MLSDVDDKTLYLIASKMTPFRLGPGMDLCTEGDMADRLWVLLEGALAVLCYAVLCRAALRTHARCGWWKARAPGCSASRRPAHPCAVLRCALR